jgi:tetratricopeptide (TPR) repeat protein
MRRQESICSILVCLGFLLSAVSSEGQASSNIGPKEPEDIVRSHEKAKEIFDQANQAWQYGDYQTAIRDCSEAIRLNPNFCDAYFCRGTIYRVSLKQYQKAISDYDAAIRIRPTLLMHTNTEDLLTGLWETTPRPLRILKQLTSFLGIHGCGTLID